MQQTSLDDFPDLTFCFDSPNNDDTTSNDSFDSDWNWISDLDELEKTLQNITNSKHFPSLSQDAMFAFTSNNIMMIKHKMDSFILQCLAGIIGKGVVDRKMISGVVAHNQINKSATSI